MRINRFTYERRVTEITYSPYTYNAKTHMVVSGATLVFGLSAPLYIGNTPCIRVV